MFVNTLPPNVVRALKPEPLSMVAMTERQRINKVTQIFLRSSMYCLLLHRRTRTNSIASRCRRCLYNHDTAWCNRMMNHPKLEYRYMMKYNEIHYYTMMLC